MHKSWLLFLFFPFFCSAETAIQHGFCQLINQKWQASLIAEVNLSSDQIEAIRNGIPLYFYYQFKLESERGWFNKSQLFTENFKLSYNHITQTYQLLKINTNKETNFLTLHDAISALGQVSHFEIASQKEITIQKPFTIQVRFSLNYNQLPFSLRLMPYLSDNWKTSSPWWECPVYR